MIRMAGGVFKAGSDDFQPEESPSREVSVAGFWMDAHHVTNAQFARFVRETGHVTSAERRDPTTGKANGSLVFKQPASVKDLQDLGQWWKLDPDANWRQPEGRGSSITALQHHPVVHVTHADALAYARWAGRDLPTELEWEFAARGGLDGTAFTWGSDQDSSEAPRANRWRGEFPFQNEGSKGYKGTSPVGCFPANGYGLFDMAGNVWHWTTTAWQGEGGATAERLAENAYVIKGGSFLCAPNYCMRYRPAARQPGEPESSAAHIGFRTVLRP